MIASPAPLRGIVQAAMDLNEAVFQSMPLEFWLSDTQPKVKDTFDNALWELKMEKCLHFFIMKSFISGKVGTATEEELLRCEPPSGRLCPLPSSS